MKVKRYIANNSQEAMMKVKSELGTDAVILHSRKIKRPGFLGFLKKPLIEMVAAIEEKNVEPKVNDKKDHIEKKISPLKNVGEISQFKDQMANIENILSDLMNKVDTKNINSQEENGIYKKYYDLLIRNNVEKSITDKIMNISSRRISFSDENEEVVCKTIKMIIRELLEEPRVINTSDKKQKVLLFVGPTGVGKTTTLAKLAARFEISDKKSVALITADTYRIGAVEQLKTYSEILDIPISVIYDPEEVIGAIEKFHDKDIILIDTAGRNHRVEEELDETKKLLKYIDEPDIFLVVSTTTSYKDIVGIAEAYKFIENYKLLFTKVDESTNLGDILNIKIYTGKSLSYITTGQSVPDDIEIAYTEKISSRIVGDHYE
ncbi:flagellar biosynthesis protein FlhF [Lutibacter sp. B2]|nr:flagellar biosynthesis protein FlhF [Lutibacter sp. B2]